MKSIETERHDLPPKVSIGLPVYNGATHLRVAIDSLLAQSYADFELIISDNASSDETACICREYASKDSRIRYLAQPSNIGATANFNFVLDAAVGEYFMWAAHDDAWEPDFLAEMTALLADPTVEIAFCRFDNVSYESMASTRVFDLSEITAPTIAQGLARFLGHAEYNGKANVFYGLLRRETVLGLGGLRIWGVGTWGADMLYVFSLLTQGRLALSQRLLFHKRSAPVGVATASVVPVLPRYARIKAESVARRQESLQWLGYWVGYWRVLRLARKVSFLDRLGLRSFVFSQIGHRARMISSDCVGAWFPRVYRKLLNRQAGQ